jgi:hypothetical protein
MPVLLLLCAGTGAFLIAVAVYADMRGVPAHLLTRDPAALHGFHPLHGAASHLGVLMWAAAASVAFFAAWLLRGVSQATEPRAFLFRAGLLTCWLMLDDLFMLHERILPDGFGIPQPLVFITYSALAALLLWRFRRLVSTTDFRPLAVSLGFFGCSLLIDLAPGEWHVWPRLVLIEDAAKLLGIVSWFAYFAGTASAALAGTLIDRASAPAGSPSRSRTPDGVVTLRGDSPTRDARDSILADVTRATPGSLPDAPLQSRTAD